MPDILIRGMEMPRNCMACSEPYEPFSMHRKCCVDGHVFLYSYVHGRDKDCPLLELPPHGDLIDRSDVFAVVDESYEYGDIIKRKDFYENNIPTIVPADKEETE